ncbi:GNAT family N-acetyltransferase [Pedobacter rhodius]|uniref:GNAT family N-acetyltransferase n=1 Tax=Pedobacter rhodius TaxID=3004098 RepID=A0ABT4KXW5_9SPHI|nr:GNAT family N-acetyltransferase [Pedobacter sp. SJ11]MCZ4223067.1 GNAT family N-acetyltransferase [Pedobacter sp. SJ11]
MDNIQLFINENREGVFFIISNGEKVGEMVFSLSETHLIVYHTEVAQRPETKGFGRKLLDAMVAYARAHQLKVTPLCPYVNAQFKKNAKEFSDLWTPDED